MDDLRPFECENGRVYMIPKNHCAFCDNCTDIFYDYTNGPYMFICNLGLGGDYRNCGSFKEDE